MTLWPLTLLDLHSAENGEFSTPRIYTTFGSSSFSVAAPQVWNHLPADSRWLSTISNFKRHLKTYSNRIRQF